MFCSKCGKEIADEAVFCSNCGCATANYHAPTTTSTQNTTYSKDYVIIKNFEDRVRSLFILSIIALALCLGFGIIFSFIVWVKANSMFVPLLTTDNPLEVAMLESAKSRLRTALKFSFVPMYILVAVTAVFGISGIIIGEPSPSIYFFIGSIIFWFIGIKCTIGLTEELK